MESASKLLADVFSRAPALGVSGVFQFEFAPKESSAEVVRIFCRVESGGTELGMGSVDRPDVSIRMDFSDFQDALEGRVVSAHLFAEGRVTIEGEMALAMHLPALMEFHRTETPENVVTEIGRMKDERFRSRRRQSEVVAARQPRILEVERRETISVEEFHESYLPCGTPVVLTGATRDWKLLDMTLGDLKHSFANVHGAVRSGDYISAAFSRDREFRSMTLSEFAEVVESGDGTDELPPYMGNNALPGPLLPLIEFPPFFSPERYEDPKMWLGPAGTLSPLHRDGFDNLFVQVWGSKRFVLGSPDQWECFYPWATAPSALLEGCDVDPENPDLERFPLFSHAQMIECRVGPGEMFFLPEGWFHQVRSLTPSFSINFWVKDSKRTRAD